MKAMKNWNKFSSTYLVMLAIFAVVACNGRDTMSEGDYLVERVPPCSNPVVSDRDPCHHPPISESSDESDGSSASGPGFDPFAVDDLVAHGLLGTFPGSNSHVVVRGITLPNTLRCSIYPDLYPPYRGKKAFHKARSLACFADIEVQDYLFGAGPNRITLRMVSLWNQYWDSDPDEPLTDAELSEWAANAETRLVELINSRYIGREWVFGIAPSGHNIAHMVWEVETAWAVEQDEQGDVLVVSRYVRDIELRIEKVENLDPRLFGVAAADPEASRRELLERLALTDEKLAKLRWPIQDFEEKVIAFFENEPQEYGSGRYSNLNPEYEWKGPTNIVTDIFDLHDHYRDDLGAFDGVSATPAVVPPAPGEPHPYPPQPTPTNVEHTTDIVDPQQ